MCGKERKPTRNKGQERPEMRRPHDIIEHHGRSLRDRYDALRPYTDRKNWR